MNIRDKQKSLVYLTLLTICMLLISASLPTLQFQPGMPIPGAAASQSSSNPLAESTKPLIEFRPLIQLPLAITFLLLLGLLFISLIRKIKFAKILKPLVGLFVVFCLMLLLNQIKLPSPAPTPIDSQGMSIKPSVAVNVAPIGNPPTELFSVVMIVLILGAIILITWFLVHSLQQAQKEDLIAKEVSKAINAIESGDDLKNVIIRCYMQMLRIAEEEQRVERLNSMTPREFEIILAAKGIPYPPIHKLTSLFEKVRYGNKSTDLSDEKLAIESLSAIQLSCQSRDRGFK